MNFPLAKIRLSRKISRKFVSRNSAEKNLASRKISRILPQPAGVGEKIRLRGLERTYAT